MPLTGAVATDMNDSVMDQPAIDRLSRGQFTLTVLVLTAHGVTQKYYAVNGDAIAVTVSGMPRSLGSFAARR